MKRAVAARRAPRQQGPRTTLRLPRDLAAMAGRPFAVPSIALTEISYGVHTDASRDASLINRLRWIRRLLDATMLVLPLDTDAAEVAGELRARHPLPPTGSRRRPGERPQQ